MNPIEIMRLLSLAMNLASQAGVNLKRFNEMRAQAEAEGRDITEEELKTLANEAQAAINEI